MQWEVFIFKVLSKINRNVRLGIAILLAAIFWGESSAFVFRGDAHHYHSLVMLTLGWGIPIGITTFVLCKARMKIYIKMRGKTKDTEQPDGDLLLKDMDLFLVALLSFVGAIFIQWGFFNYGYNVLGQRDFLNALTLCMASEDVVAQGVGEFRLESLVLDSELPDGTEIKLGNISNPIIIYWKRNFRVEGKNGEDPSTRTEETVLCRFRDPRVLGDSQAGVFTYDYMTKEWDAGAAGVYKGSINILDVYN